jgi:hypothetical protein
MNVPLLPAPDTGPRGASDHDENGTRSRRRRRTQAGPLPTVDEVLRSLLDLNGTVMLRLVSLDTAKFIQKNLNTYINIRLRQKTSPEPHLDTHDLAELCRKAPEVVDLLAPLLTDEQVAFLQTMMGEDR